MDKFDKYAFEICKINAAMSKDPSTKVGSVILRPDRTICSTGYNGFPKGDSDEMYDDRIFKYENIIHAELNSIIHSRECLHGYSIYVWPLPPCERCTAIIIQSGIKFIHAPKIEDGHRWHATSIRARDRAYEHGIKYYCHENT